MAQGLYEPFPDLKGAEAPLAKMRDCPYVLVMLPNCMVGPIQFDPKLEDTSIEGVLCIWYGLEFSRWPPLWHLGKVL